jgi:CRISPR/Cas system CSM-associated protein Csm4 (group 5 of RAMP superfamily)
MNYAKPVDYIEKKDLKQIYERLATLEAEVKELKKKKVGRPPKK